MESFRISLGSQLTLELKEPLHNCFISNSIFELATKDYEGCYEVASILKQFQVCKVRGVIPAISRKAAINFRFEVQGMCRKFHDFRLGK